MRSLTYFSVYDKGRGDGQREKQNKKEREESEMKRIGLHESQSECWT